MDMGRFLLFSLLTDLLLIESITMENCKFRPAKEIGQKVGQSAELQCGVSCSNKHVHYEWFVFKEHSHYHVNLTGAPLKYNLVGGSLHIKSVNNNDSGIYYCAAMWPRESTRNRQYVGEGTTLIVRGHGTRLVKYILLWLSFVLLSIYSIVILSLIIKKCGCNRSKSTKAEETDKTTSDKKAAKRRTQFRDVLEEMYSNRNTGRKKQSVGRDKVEAASTDFTDSNDDIYQNV
ncbi:immunoglobulin superfamily member 6 [Betta splendens]|uniref:immunoglobulin superfamily member 6 n=1 Tax=Betta splendens TaxID=158456 RepID=UPI0010F9F7F7|nr:immunoglobulin superfamily member 6 [Betta splendens]